jgi:hypothetical protein
LPHDSLDVSKTVHGCEAQHDSAIMLQGDFLQVRIAQSAQWKRPFQDLLLKQLLCGSPVSQSASQSA